MRGASASAALAAQLLDQQQCITSCSRHASLLQTALLTTAQQAGSRVVSFNSLKVTLQALHSSVGLPGRQGGSNYSSDSCQSISSDQHAAATLQQQAWDVHLLSRSSQQQRQLLCGQPALPQHTPVQFPAAVLHAVLGLFKGTSAHAAPGGRAYSTWQGQQQQQQQQQQRRSSLQQQRQQQPTWRRGQQQQQQQQQQPTRHHLQQQQQQQQQHYSVTPWRNIQDPRLAKLATEAFAPQHSRQQRADILHAALDWCLQQLAAAAATNNVTSAQQLYGGMQQRAGVPVNPTDIAALLHCFELSRTAVHWPAMQELVQYMDGTAQLYDCKVILRVLRSASFSKLAAPLSSSSSSSRGGARASAPTSNLLTRVWDLTENGQEPLRPASVPQLLRCASVLLDSAHHRQQQQQQQQRVSNELLDSMICHWLNGCGVGTAEDSSSSSSSSSGVTGSGSSSSRQQMAQQAAMIIKAVLAMNMQVGGPVLQRLLLPVQAVVQDCIGASSSSSSSSRGGSRANAIEAASWVPTLLTATHGSDRDSVLSISQQGQALELASKTLQGLAAASAAAAAAAFDTSSSSSGEALTAAAVASSIVNVARSLSTIQRASPIKKVDGLVDGLTQALLVTNAPFRQLSAFATSLAALNLAPSLGSMADLTAAACAKQQQQQQQQQDVGFRQQQQQQWDRNCFSQFLWASAAMGYSLGAQELQVMLQQLLSLEGCVTGQVAQALWAIALMGSPQQQQQWDHSLAPGVAELACQLLSRVLEEQQALAGSSSSSGTSTFSSSSSTGNSSQRAGHSFVDLDAWMGPERGVVSMHGHASWQLSVVAWAAAMCDLTMCKDTVLGLCSILARPHMWSALRQAEHVQLLLVQLWLSGDYQWSDKQGLASVLQPEQLEVLRQAKLAQTMRAAADAAAVLKPSSAAAGAAAGAGAGAASAEQVQSARRPESVMISQAQLAVWRTLTQMPTVYSAALEALTLDKLFNVDVLVKLRSGEKLAVEFDGPYHFAVAVPSAAAGGGEGSGGEGAAEEGVVVQQQQQQEQEQGVKVFQPSGRAAVRRTLPTGKPQQQQQQQVDLTPQLVPVRRVLFRNKVLAARGLTVVSVPYYAWREQQTKPKRLQYLRQLIREAH